MIEELIDQDALRDEAKAIGLIKEIYLLRSKQNAAAGDLKPLEKQLKAYLDLEGKDELVDGEVGLRAFYEYRSNDRYDVRSMEPGLVYWLAQQGLLSLNVTSYRALKKGAPASELDLVQRYLIPEKTAALKIEAIE